MIIQNVSISMGSIDSLFPSGDYKMFYQFTAKNSEFIAEVAVFSSATTSSRDTRKATVG